MANFVSLEEAAKKLGRTVEELVEMRSRGDIYGYRDGQSWKFKPEEIQRVASELMGDVLDEDPAGSSILSFEPEKPSASGSSSSGLGSSKSGSDVSLQVDPSSSDVRLVASSDISLDAKSTGSGISDLSEVDLRMADDDDDDDVLSSGGEDLEIASGSDPGNPQGTGSSNLDLDLGSDLKLSEGSGDLIRGDSDPAIVSGAGSDVNLDSDIELADDVVLGDGSDLVLAADSGINLMSPADSGISLEEEPLDAGESGVSGLDFDVEVPNSGSDVASGVGSGIDFHQDEEFQLSPSGAFDGEQDSGSQAIEIEDSSEVGSAISGGLGGFDDVGGADAAFDDADAFGGLAPTAGPAVAAIPDVPFSALQVASLLLILLVLSFSGILVSDVVRNLWMWSGNESASSLTSGFTQMLVGK